MKVLFLLEHVRENHMKKKDDSFVNIFFQTEAGKILKRLIEDGLKLTRNDYYVDYAYGLIPKVIKRDKFNRAIKYKQPTQKEAKPEFEVLYDKIVREKPDIIIPTGNLGCKALLGVASISKQRGVPQKVNITTNTSADGEFSSSLSHEVWVLPTYSIEYMLVQPNIRNLIEADFITLQKFIEQGESAFEASPVEYEFVDNIERVREIFKEDLPKAPIVAWDLETNTLRPEFKGAKPLVISLSWKEGQGCTIPLEHKDFTWLPGQLAEIYELIKEFVGNPDIVKVGHNLQYDIRFLRLVKGFTEFKNHRDTKVMYYLLVNQDVESSLKLSDLSYEMTDMGGYDKPLEEFKKQYVKEAIQKSEEEKARMKQEYKEAVALEKQQAKQEKRPPVLPEKPKFPSTDAPVNEVDGSDFSYEWIPLKSVLHPYASGDTDACLRIYNKLDAVGRKEENARIRELYTKAYPELTVALAKIEANGVKMDTEYTKGLVTKYEEEENRLLEEMRKFPEVQRLEEEYRTLYQRGMEEMLKPKEDRNEEIAKLRDRYKNKLIFNPNASVDKQKVLYEYTGNRLPYNKEFLTDSTFEDGIPEDEVQWYNYKADKAALNYVAENFEESAELANLLLTHSLVKTRKRNFTYKLLSMVDHNGILHGGFNPTGTACVSGDTLLVTGKGIKPIQSLSNNRRENTFSDISINVHSHKGVEKADGFYYSGVRKSRHILLQDGTELITSYNHPLLKNAYLSQRTSFNKSNKVFSKHIKAVEWAKSEDINSGDYIALKVGTNLYGNKTILEYDKDKYSPTATSHTKHGVIPHELTPELAEWVGMYMADGSISTHNGSVNLGISNDDEEVIARFTYLTKNLFNLDVSVVRTGSRTPFVSLCSSHVGSWLMDVMEIKSGAANKTVPACILESTKEVQQGFIRGLTLDSSTEKKKYPSLYLSSTSKDMMMKVRAMLLNMGIYCRAAVVKSYSSNRSPIYSVMITYNHLSSFMDTIGVVETAKRERVMDKLEQYRNKQSKGKMIGVVESDDYIFVRVKKVTEGVDELFDLHVPESHSFVGNGVVNHNTTRLSAQSPNLQQIPRKTGDVTRFDYKHPIKRMFVTSFEGGALLQLDYSSLESRVLALAARDEEMTQAFLDGADVHKDTASLVFNVPIEQVTDDMRSDAKSTTFGIAYGETPFSYYAKHGMTLEQAEKLFDDFFRNKPRIKQFIDGVHEQVKKEGFVECLHGFRRNLQDVYSRDSSKRNAALRQSVNTKIQGSGAFLTNSSVVHIMNFIERNNFRSRVILTVHDSIVLDCPPEEIHIMAKAAKHIMENLPIDWLFIDWKGGKLRYPIAADVEIGVNYNDMVDYNMEDINTFRCVKNYCKYHLDLKNIKNYKNSNVITEEKYEELKHAVESKKDVYQNAG